MASSGSGAIRRCSVVSVARRSPRFGVRSSRPSRPRSGVFCPPGTGSAGGRRCARRSSRCRRSPVPVSLWESEVLPRRVPGYRPEQLDALCASGEAVWVGAGLDRVAVFFRDDASVLGAPAGAPRPETPEADAIARGPRPRGAVLARPARGDRRWRRRGARRSLGARLGRRGDERRLDAAPGGAALRRAAGRAQAAPFLAQPRRAGDVDPGPLVARRRGSSRVRATGGRWPSSCSSARESSRATAFAARASRAVTAPSTPSCARSRPSGVCRRGYFVEGLGGAQFALPGAVERLRELRAGDGADALVLAAADPAQPYGAALPWPRRAGARAARVAGAHVVLLGGAPALFVERGGRSLIPLRDPEGGAGCGATRSTRSSPTCGTAGQAARGGALRRRAGDGERRPAAAGRGGVPRRPAPRRPAALAARCPKATSSTGPPRRSSVLVGERVAAESPHPRGAVTGVAPRGRRAAARIRRRGGQEPPAALRGRSRPFAAICA